MPEEIIRAGWATTVCWKRIYERPKDSFWCFGVWEMGAQIYEREQWKWGSRFTKMKDWDGRADLRMQKIKIGCFFYAVWWERVMRKSGNYGKKQPVLYGKAFYFHQWRCPQIKRLSVLWVGTLLLFVESSRRLRAFLDAAPILYSATKHFEFYVQHQVLLDEKLR